MNQADSLRSSRRRHSVPRRRGLLGLAFLAPALLAGLPPAADAKDIAILIDRSMSVEPGNRTEAVELIHGLLTGSVPAETADRWHFIAGEVDDADQDRQKHHEEKSAQIKDLLGGSHREGLAPGPHKLFRGAFGNLDTVQELDRTEWKNVSDPSAAGLREWSDGIPSKDAETHLELARAVTANLLEDKDSFYLFVVSDGVEDLVNWPVSSYLDPDKCENLESLAEGKFRDADKERTLDQLNRQRRNGRDLNIGGRTVPGYGRWENDQLDRYSASFSEKFLGRISLKAPDLREFFTSHRGKVPVSVLVYSADVKSQVEIDFTLRFRKPLDSTRQDPEPINPSSSTVEWEGRWKSVPPEGETILEILLPDRGEPWKSQVVADSGSLDLLEKFPNLPEGDLELRLIRNFPSQKPIQRSAYLRWKPDVPSRKLEFAEPWKTHATAKLAYKFDPRRDRDILGTKFEWQWTSGDSVEKTSPPEVITRTLTLYDFDSFESNGELDQPYHLLRDIELKQTEAPPTGATLEQILDSSGNGGVETLPLGALYRFQVTGAWADDAKVSAETWFVLPEPRLVILGQEADGAAGGLPRKVKQGETIRIGNWMDGWKGYRYDLTVRKDGSEILRNRPLELKTRGGGTLIEVIETPDSEVSFTVTFGPDDETLRDKLPTIGGGGLVAPAGTPILPWILGSLVLVTLGLFAWNFSSRR